MKSAFEDSIANHALCLKRTCLSMSEHTVNELLKITLQSAIGKIPWRFSVTYLVKKKPKKTKHKTEFNNDICE